MSTRSTNAAITAYPLQWPAGWKRTDPAWRVQAKFGKARRETGYGENRRWTPARDLTIAEGVERVLAELKRMGLGRDDVVISTNLRLRLDGLPHSQQSEPTDPGVAGMKREWWAVLDCSPNSGREVIEQSFRRLASRYHPDKDGGDVAKMAELNAAREEALRAVSPS